MSDILNKVALLATAVGKERASKDIELWKAWKQSPTDRNLQALLNNVNGLIQNEVGKWSGTLARPVLEAEARRLAVIGFDRYDPNRGAALGTHVSNYLKKLSRLSYSHQSIARLPENKRLKYHTYDLAHAELYDQLGRDPTTDELADNLGWSTKYLTQFQQEAARKELLESGPTPKGFESDAHDPLVDFVYHDLAPTQKKIVEHLTGYGGMPILSNQQIMKKLDLTQGQYSYQKRLIENTFTKASGG